MYIIVNRFFKRHLWKFGRIFKGAAEFLIFKIGDCDGK